MTRVLAEIDKGSDVKNLHSWINVLDGCHWVATAVRGIETSTVEKCFARCGFADATDLEDDEEDDVALATLIRRWQDTANVDQPLDAATFVTFDDDVPCSGDDCTTAVAVEENDDDDKDGNDEQPELQEHPSRAEVLKALDVLKNICIVE